MASVEMGTGAPLLALAGLTADHQRPTGAVLKAELGPLRALAGRRRVLWVNRRPGLPPGITMTDLAADYAAVLQSRYERPVDVFGISTGGSIALQLAADHPQLVRRLVVVAAAHTLGPVGRAAQGAAADWAARGKPRRAAAALMGVLGASRRTRLPMRTLGWLLGPMILRTDDPTDMVRTVRAERGFAFSNRLTEITCPTPVVGGERDQGYAPPLPRNRGWRRQWATPAIPRARARWDHRGPDDHP